MRACSSCVSAMPAFVPWLSPLLVGAIVERGTKSRGSTGCLLAPPPFGTAAAAAGSLVADATAGATTIGGDATAAATFGTAAAAATFGTAAAAAAAAVSDGAVMGATK